jgi:hypothetical protein
MAAKFFLGIQYILIVNFAISVVLLIAGSTLSLSDRFSLFDFNQELYGELVSHLKITMFYLAITETIICAYCFFTKTTKAIVLAGFFLILMVGSLYFYGQINDLEIDENLYLFFLYTGISHIIFGVLMDLTPDLHGVSDK